MAIPTEEFVINSVKVVLEREKSTLFDETNNAHCLGDISKAISELQRLTESVVKANLLSAFPKDFTNLLRCSRLCRSASLDGSALNNLILFAVGRRVP